MLRESKDAKSTKKLHPTRNSSRSVTSFSANVQETYLFTNKSDCLL